MSDYEYIPWSNSYNFESKVLLGSNNDYYYFNPRYNALDDSWYINIYDIDRNVILAGRKLTLNTDLLNRVYKNKPNCIIKALTDNNYIDRVSKDNIINGDVKVYVVNL